MFLAVAGLIGGGVALAGNHRLGDTAGGPLIGFGLLGLVVWVVLAVVLSKTAIRLTYFSGTSLALSGVSRKFGIAVAARRREERVLGSTGSEPIDYEERLRWRRDHRLRRPTRDEMVDVPDTDSQEPIHRGKYQVVGIPTGDGPKRLIASFDDLEKARECAAFMKNSGNFLHTAVEESAP